jgi:hypothetical protein
MSARRWGRTGVLGVDTEVVARLPDLAAARPTDRRRGIPGRGDMTGRTGRAVAVVLLWIHNRS